jgi:hypothetical protein
MASRSTISIAIILVFFLCVTIHSATLEGELKVLDKQIEFVFQAPKDITGIILLAHGCSHSATDWWPKSQSCPQCIGLPVERSIVEAALNHGYLAVALSSFNRRVPLEIYDYI